MIWHFDTSLNEASSLTPEEKMQAWHYGDRKENIKACGDAKLQLYYDICMRKGYMAEAKVILEEAKNRGLSWAIKAAAVNSMYAGNTKSVAQYLKDLTFSIQDFHTADATFVEQNKDNYLELATSAFGAKNLPVDERLKAFIIYIIFALVLGYTKLAGELKDILPHDATTINTLKEVITNVISDKTIMAQLTGIKKDILPESLQEKIEKHDKLNPKLFDENKHLYPEVREKLLQIANEFIKGIKEDEVKFNLKDIKIVGSNCSYNYNPDSDLDLHLVAETKSLACPDDLYPIIYNLYKSAWNNAFEPTIKGIPVELYVETEVSQENPAEEPVNQEAKEKLEEKAMIEPAFDSEAKEGDKIRIIHLEGEDTSYDGKEGTVEHIDGIGQLHGTWGGLAVIPGVDEFEIINESLKEDKKLNETSVRLMADTWTIEESSILEYYPNKHQVEAYISKAKAVELAEAANGNTVRVIIYEKFERKLREWPYYENVLSPVKICYDSIENPKVAEILVQNKLMTENLEEAKNIVGREKVSSWSTDTAKGYKIKVERNSVDLGGFVYTVDQYKKEIEDKNNYYKSNFNIEPDPYKKAALADKRPLADRLDELLASGKRDMEIAVVAGSAIRDMRDYLEAKGIKFTQNYAKGATEIFRLEDGRTITLHLVFIENVKKENLEEAISANPLISNGVYSVLDDKWIKEPVVTEIPEVNQKEIDAALAPWLLRYNEITKEPSVEAIEEFMDDLYKARQTSIMKEGEYNPTNHAFKSLRAAGQLDELRELKRSLKEKELSLESLKEELYKITTVDGIKSVNGKKLSDEYFANQSDVKNFGWAVTDTASGLSIVTKLPTFKACKEYLDNLSEEEKAKIAKLKETDKYKKQCELIKNAPLEEDIEKEIQISGNKNIEKDEKELNPPISLDYFVNNMGINLNSVESEKWTLTDDEQLKKLEVEFIPAEKEEAFGLDFPEVD